MKSTAVSGMITWGLWTELYMADVIYAQFHPVTFDQVQGVGQNILSIPLDAYC